VRLKVELIYERTSDTKIKYHRKEKVQVQPLYS